jgi:glycosyltransferase involved in cell wall biosynthesis
VIRILHVLGGLERGGAETMVMNLYRAIDRTQIQFDFIIHTEEHQAYYSEICDLGGKIYSFPKYNGKNYFAVKKNWNSFFVNHPEYKILHSHIRSYASLYIPVAKKHGVKTIIHSHSTSNGKGFLSIVKRFMQYPLRNQADFFMGCSKEAGEWLFGKKVVKSDRYFMLQNAIDVEAYRFNDVIREKYRSELGLKDELTFIHVGRFHPAKNHEFLLTVFAEIHKRNDNTKLILVGDGDLRPEIERQISDLQLGSSVILTGSRSDVPKLLQAADCFLFPSRWEGLPVTVVEAQASGMPCLISNRITKDVNVSPLVKYLSIDNGADIWVNSLDEIDYSRQDAIELIKNARFDISSTAIWLQNFYQGLM